MANTLPGTPYVESSDLVANYPAVSESLAERVDLVGILPFASSTARGTALPTPTDGQYTYLQDTNSTQFWNGSAWQNAGIDPGLQIVSPTSIANSGGSASASGGKVTFTGVSSVSLNGVFTSAYENYLVIGSYLGSGNIAVRARYRVSGTDNSTASSYITQTIVGAGSAVTGNRLSADYRRFVEANTTLGNFSWRVCGPNLAANTSDWLEGTTEIATAAVLIDGGGHNSSTVFDGFSVYTTSGTITGTIRVYGYRNS